VPLQSDFRQRIVDIDLQHRFVVSRHTLTWGAEYRCNSDTNFQTPVLFFVPPERTYPLETAFVQDEISLAAERLKVQFGSKFEHNDFTGFEAQPSIRAGWTARADQFIWGAVSRAVRTPTRFDSDIRFGPPGFQFVGNPNFQSESVVAFELGYRAKPLTRVSVDLATFYNTYDRIRSLEAQPGTGILLLNNANARTYGGELSATYDVLEHLRVLAGYSYLQRRLTFDPGHVDVFNGTIEGNDPKHQFFARGSADLSRKIEVDCTVRFVSSLPAPLVPSYTEMDARVGWFVSPRIELSVTGRNLLHEHHPEYGSPSPAREEVERNVYGRVSMRF
jgi:iron complex outermembrane receptor protein